jgi:RNA polymerase primary sigma factor
MEAAFHSREQEHQAAEGDNAIVLYFREVGHLKVLEARQEEALAVKARSGDNKARQELLKSSLRLVVEIAREYEDIGLSLLDLVSEGNLGLLKALERFDPARDGRFSSFAVWWIKRSLKRALRPAPGS